VAIVSGLNIGSKADIDLNIQLLTEYLSGELGSEQVGAFCCIDKEAHE
jgi:hypothetical protein